MKGRREFIIALTALAALLTACGLLYGYTVSLKRDISSLTARKGELVKLSAEYSALKQRVDAVEKKQSLTKVAGVVEAVDDVFEPLGLKQKVKSVKSTGTRELKDGVQEEAEVIVEKATMNEMVNIFHKIETAPMAVSVKRASIKTAFDNPQLLNMSVTVSLIKPK